MSENLVACEFEDSTNCVWNAQEEGNGVGESFVDIDGTAHYVEDVSEAIDIEYEDGFFVDCETQLLHFWYIGSEGNNIVDEGTPASPGEMYNYGCTVETNDSLLVELPEAEVPEPIESVGVQPTPPEYIETAVLAETGTTEVIMGVLVGLALIAAGVVLFIRGRKNK